MKKFVSHENNLKPMIQIIEEPVKNEEKEKKSPKHGEESKTKTQMLYFEEEEKQKMKKQKMEILMETLKFQNFRSFLPLPNYKFGNKGIIDNSNSILLVYIN